MFDDSVFIEYLTKDKIKHHVKRMLLHERLVKHYCLLLDNSLTLHGALIKLSKVHDLSKWNHSAEVFPYILINWRYHERFYNMPVTEYPDHIEKAMTAATAHHIQVNKHHPEHWDPGFNPQSKLNHKDRDSVPTEPVNATLMPELYLTEMVADWSAVSHEINDKLRPSELYGWFESNVLSAKPRWLFTDQQKEYISRCIRLVVSQ